MPRIVIELTNRCNLSCGHCFDERHAATGELSLDIIRKVVHEAKPCGIDQVSFTGGEPTIHRRFREIIDLVSEAEYPFSFVTNGSTFPKIYPLLLRWRRWFRGVTFSLDGAREATHDRLRGQDSFRAVMRAASICVLKQLPFTFNMVLTAENQHEVAELITLASGLGSAGVRFGHLMPTPNTSLRKLDLSPEERRRLEEQIWRLKETAPVPVGMAPGYFSAEAVFRCGPLELEEYNLDYRGNLSLCCQLSGHSGPADAADSFGNLNDVSLADACERFRQHVERYLADKQEKITKGKLCRLDYFPCWYCLKYHGKTSWLERFPDHSWNEGDMDDGNSRVVP